MKGNTSKFFSLLRAVSCAWLVCVAFNSLTVFAVGSQTSPDLVFCPLQKQYVKRSVPTPVVAKVSFKDICAVESDKANFLNRIVLSPSVRVSDQAAADALFFDFAAKGDRAFTAPLPVPGHPESPEVSLTKIQLAASSGQVDPVVENIHLFSPDHLSRPPTRSAISDFPQPEFRDLKNISNAIQPRAPPVSL